MKQFEWYDIECALTHNLDVCEHCKKCGEYPNVRMDMAEYVECLEKALDMACEKLRHSGYCDTLWECENNDISLKYESCEACIKDHLLRESENQDGKD